MADRVIDALNSILAQANSSDSAYKESFLAKYKDSFTELFLKVSVHARSRKDSRVRDALEQAWTALYTNSVPFPTVPGEVKVLEIFPGTSLSDALKLLQEHSSDKNNSQVALKFLDTAIAEEKKIPLSQLRACVDLCAPLVPQNALANKLKETCQARISTFIALERAKESAEQQRIERLKTSKNPAAKRALNFLERKQASNEKDYEEEEEEEVPRLPPTRRLTDEEWEREYLKRAKLSNEQREQEEERSRRLGREEDIKAAKYSSSV